MQDKQVQRDDEYYEGDNDNDQNMDDAWSLRVGGIENFDLL